MAFAIRVETESGDQYMFALDGKPNQEAIMKRLQNEMGDELGWVIDYSHAATYPIDFELDLNLLYKMRKD